MDGITAGHPQGGGWKSLAASPGGPLAVLLLGGCLNGLVARAADAWHVEGASTAISQLFGISPFELIVIAIAVEALVRGQGATRAALGIPAVAFALLATVPSGLLSWLATTLYAAYAAWRCTGEARRGALLVAGLGACAAWWGFGDRLVGDVLLKADAVATTAVLSLGVEGVQRVGNLITMPWGHSVVILITCSTGYGLPLSMLSMAALASRNEAPAKRIAVAAAGLAVAYFLANLVRLCLLAWSPEFYHVGHGPIGMGAFDAVATVLTLAAAALAARTNDARP